MSYGSYISAHDRKDNPQRTRRPRAAVRMSPRPHPRPRPQEMTEQRVSLQLECAVCGLL